VDSIQGQRRRLGCQLAIEGQLNAVRRQESSDVRFFRAYVALLAAYTYRSKGGRHGRGAGAHITEPEMPRKAKEILGVIDRFHDMRSDLEGRFPPGCSGDHGWMTVIDQGFTMHTYFCEDTIRFELYGPKPPGEEKEPGDSYDGSGLYGELDADTLKSVVTLLDQGKSPREYVQAHAKKCSVVTHD
jgi:hypothetical protein